MIKDGEQGESGCEPTKSRAFEIREGSIIPTEVPLPCLVALRGPGPAVSDPPLCSVLQMGGGAVQTRAAGVHGGIPAAGWETSTQLCSTDRLNECL